MNKHPYSNHAKSCPVLIHRPNRLCPHGFERRLKGCSKLDKPLVCGGGPFASGNCRRTSSKSSWPVSGVRLAGRRFFYCLVEVTFKQSILHNSVFLKFEIGRAHV